MSRSEKRFRTAQLNLRLSNQEKSRIELKSRQAGMSASRWVREIALYFPPPKSIVSERAVTELVRTKNDFNRFSNLIKYHITMSVGDKVMLGSRGKEEIDSLLKEIESKQQELLHIAQKILGEINGCKTDSV